MTVRGKASGPIDSGGFEADILRSLRRITRAIDIYSRQLVEHCGLTTPQLLCLRVLVQHGEMKATALARQMTLSPATVTGIVDRLVARGLVTRNRSDEDRRTVTLGASPEGRRAAAQVPSLLQDQLAARLRDLPVAEQERVRDALREVVRMMDAEDLDVAPMLSSGPVDVSADRMRSFFAPATPGSAANGASVAPSADAAPAPRAPRKKRGAAAPPGAR